jgi:hypothetical protein
MSQSAIQRLQNRKSYNFVSPEWTADDKSRSPDVNSLALADDTVNPYKKNKKRKLIFLPYPKNTLRYKQKNWSYCLYHVSMVWFRHEKGDLD